MTKTKDNTLKLSAPARGTVHIGSTAVDFDLPAGPIPADAKPEIVAYLVECGLATQDKGITP